MSYFKPVLFLVLAAMSLFAASYAAITGGLHANEMDILVGSYWETLEKSGASETRVREEMPWLGNSYVYVPHATGQRVTVLHDMFGPTLDTVHRLGVNSSRFFLVNAGGFFLAAWLTRRPLSSATARSPVGQSE